MTNPLGLDNPSGLRNVIYTIIGGLVLQGFAAIWYVSKTEAQFDARITNLEHQANIAETLMTRLNDSREDTRVHFAQVDSQLSDMNGKLGAILGIVQSQTSDIPAGGGQPNFPRQSGR